MNDKTVDVLAVMDAAAWLSEKEGFAVDSSNLREARTAVAELIEAAWATMPATKDDCDLRQARVFAALARVGGAK